MLDHLRLRFWLHIYSLSLWLLQAVHRANDGWCDWKWLTVAECGCCGFEGMVCQTCHRQVVIGYAGYPHESGDYVEYGC